MRKYAGALCLVVIALLVFAPTAASAAFQAHIAVKGKKQGQFKGENVQTQRPITKQTDQASPKLMQRRK
jgi:hypothetical protein